MSIEVRRTLQGCLLFQNPPAQRPQLTEFYGAGYALNTDLIAAIAAMVHQQMLFVVTALRDDHSIDGCLGPDNHNPAGKAMDFWFLNSSSPTDYMDARSEQFVTWVGRLASLPYVTGVGLGGSSDSVLCREAAGGLAFSDNSSDHLHIQVS